MSVGVTAATGRLGRAVINELLKRMPAEQVCAVARDPARVAIPGVLVRPGDYNAPDELRAAFSTLDTLVMISAPVAGGGDRLALHRAVIDAAVAAGVSRLIYTSVIGNERAEGTYFEPFYRVNQATERYLRESGLNWVAARNALYLDLDIGHVRLADQRDGVYRNNGGEGRCGYASIAELAFALAELAVSDHCDGEVVNLVGDLHTQAELVALANEALGLNVRYEAISVEENIARLMQDERIAARGVDVAQMLTGCFQCIARGAFEVSSDFSRAAGRPARSIPEQLADLA